MYHRRYVNLINAGYDRRQKGLSKGLVKKVRLTVPLHVIALGEKSNVRVSDVEHVGRVHLRR